MTDEENLIRFLQKYGIDRKRTSESPNQNLNNTNNGTRSQQNSNNSKGRYRNLGNKNETGNNSKENSQFKKPKPQNKFQRNDKDKTQQKNRKPIKNTYQKSKMDWFTMEPQPGTSRSTNNPNIRPLIPPKIPPLIPPLIPRTNYGGSYVESTSEGSKVEKNEKSSTNKKPRDYIGFKRLQDMCDMEVEKLVPILSLEEVGFDKLLKRDNSKSQDVYVLILRLIRKICDSPYVQFTSHVLSTFCQKEFIDNLLKYTQDITLQTRTEKYKNKYLWENLDEFWENVLIIFETILKVIPTTGCEALPKIVKATGIAIRNIEDEHDVNVPEHLKKRYEEFQVKLVICIEERERKMVEVDQENEDDLEPPDDFRKLSLYPEVNELLTDEKAFIRPNIVDRKYKSIDHYLDIHFRLLREDFIAPLRNGITNYISNLKTKKKQRIFDVRIYPKVQFTMSKSMNDKIIKIVKFNQNPKNSKIKLENSRRLMYGSLVCFTNDNFKKIIFGTVYERKPEYLKNGEVGVELCSENIQFNTDYIMIECNIYFEPYYHVLKALQNMDEYKFPFPEYIIDLTCNVKPPEYLELSPVMSYLNDGFCPLQKNTWLGKERLNFDDSQYKAFHAALTNEFCVIQGPPGTGKTFIGLKITDVLLQNPRLWHTAPILVICFTNHALDQFLEGILQFTNSICRIGGQSKNLKLSPFNIRELRVKRRRKGFTTAALLNKRDQLIEIMEKIKQTQSVIEFILSYSSILNFNTFAENDLLGSDRFDGRSELMIEWLLGRFNVDENDIGRENNYNNQRVVNDVEVDSDDDNDDIFLDAEEIENERRINDVDILFKDDELFRIISHYNQIISLETMKDEYTKLESRLQSIDNQPDNEYVLYDEKQEITDKIEKLNNKYRYLEYRLNQRRNGEYPKPPNNVNYNQLNTLPSDERWGLYWKWVDDCYKLLTNKLNQLENVYRQTFREYEEMNSIEDIQLLKTLKVIGMTTTGAARYQTLLQALNCPIVIVEEAAEVLETHIVVALTQGCQHLILIGDHKQLRPTTAVYQLAKKYNLEISLFERMVQNGVHCHTLEVQHRMRPEIASLIVPAIYPKLENHESVRCYPPVQGTTKNLFFIKHNEEEEVLEDSSSRLNRHEAEFIIRLARHFILQGYEPDEITILTTYSGQMFQLWKERKKYDTLKDVRITVVDNFQGEESKIILLSLVRSNTEGNIGFLRIDNRVNVALSRAKEGLFIIGNMDILLKNNEIWPKINQTLESIDCIDTSLTLKCQIHPEELNFVQKAADFLKLSEGGCTLPCMKSLDCGHVCKSMCHIVDREHKEYRCKERCVKILCNFNHQCPDHCYKPCSPCKVPVTVRLDCGHSNILPCHLDPKLYKCPTLEEVVLECEHRVNKPCHADIKTFACTHVCDIRRDCGHSCELKCHIKTDPDHLKTKCYKPCERIKVGCSTDEHKCQLRCYEECLPCDTLVSKQRTVCVHVHKVKCCEDVDEIKCERRCDKKMSCGHPCRMKCCEPCGNCNVIVDKVYDVCGHRCLKIKCGTKPNRKNCTKKCPLTLPCGHLCQARCNQNCTESCRELVDCPVRAKCGHVFKIPCHVKNKIVTNDDDLLRYCTEPCGALLKCEHKCSGTCGKCAQGRIHFNCQEQCGQTMICGHACEIPCREACMPCTKKCSFSCVHSKCGKNCGQPCVICTEICTRRCDHQRCRKRCGDKCEIDPCEEPCPKRLKCGHSCIGFCGDFCPPVCRECQPDHETFTIFLGDEDEPDARFVYLVDCEHIIEANAMKMWMAQGNNNEINVKCCPKCKQLVLKTQRYSDYIKDSYKKIINVKYKLFGKTEDNKKIQTKLFNKVTAIQESNSIFCGRSKKLTSVLNLLKNELQPIKKEKKHILSTIELNSFEIEINMIEKLIKIFAKYNGSVSDIIQKCTPHADFLLNIILKLRHRITKQVIEDFELEFLRFERLIEIFKLESNGNFRVTVGSDKGKNLYEMICTKLKSITKYSNQEDNQIKRLIEEFGVLVDTTYKISKEEKLMVASAMGMQQGHWFQCPNGHIYCIGECGGAMQISKCNECGAPIGGTRHTLLQDNRLDSSMDGARHAAWSDATNLANYRF